MKVIAGFNVTILIIQLHGTCASMHVGKSWSSAVYAEFPFAVKKPGAMFFIAPGKLELDTS
jgi:hypothetical protein